MLVASWRYVLIVSTAAVSEIQMNVDTIKQVRISTWHDKSQSAGLLTFCNFCSLSSKSSLATSLQIGNGKVNYKVTYG